MLRKIAILLMTLSLCVTTLACSSSNSTQSYRNPTNASSAPTRMSEGQYPVQQATYNDIDGEYTIMLLNTPPGTPSTLRTTDLQMARLTDEEIQSGKKTYLDVNNGQSVMHLTEDFKIEYVHNETQTQTNPQTGQPETVVVRQQSSFWTPFAGALAGQAIGSMLFRPHYYVPPVYQPGEFSQGMADTAAPTVKPSSNINLATKHHHRQSRIARPSGQLGASIHGRIVNQKQFVARHKPVLVPQDRVMVPVNCALRVNLPGHHLRGVVVLAVVGARVLMEEVAAPSVADAANTSVNAELV